MSRRRRRHIIGLIPRLLQGLLHLGRWLLRHPQPFLVTGALGGAVWMLWLYVQRIDAFRVAQVRLPADVSLKVPDSVIGSNIWEVDLKALAEELKRQKPSLKTVRVIRQLPDTLRVETLERHPVAQVRLDRWYPVDREGFILPQGRPQPADELVRLLGAETPRAPLSFGRLNTAEQLQLALRILDTLRRDAVLSSHQLLAIDVSDPQQVSFVIDPDTEVRCGSEDELDVQLERLRAVLDRVARRPMEVRYIDVRFPEPVVSPKT